MTQKPVREAQRLANTYGGKPKDWQKITSKNSANFEKFSLQVHAFRNVTTGKIVEVKDKLQ